MSQASSSENAIVQSNQVRSCFFSTYRATLKWNAHSQHHLEQAESTILSNVKVPFNRFYVPVGQCVGSKDEIWTLTMNTESKETPIVMLHGFGAGIAFWVMNLEEISARRPLYAIDLLGFGKSSRPSFSHQAEEIEQQFATSIEKWREAMQIPKMILLGHSFGGFLASSYAMKHPDRIEHLILVDPWGYTDAPDLSNLPLWKRSLVRVFRKMSPLAVIRAVGPFGEWLVRKGRPDILRKYESVVDDQQIIAQYIHQCNSHKNASGEVAFHRLLEGGPWAKHPMGERMIEGIKDDIPITFLYGATSWMNNSYGPIIKEARPKSYTHIENVENAGHHVYSDNASDFNQFVNNACSVLKSGHA